MLTESSSWNGHLHSARPREEKSYADQGLCKEYITKQKFISIFNLLQIIIMIHTGQTTL